MINIHDLLIDNKPKTHSIKGVWFLIQWTPDDYSMERFNIGVAFESAEGVREVKLCDSYKMLSNWYGQDITKQANLIKKIATHKFKNDFVVNMPKDYIYDNGIHYQPMGFAQGDSIVNVLNMLYKDVVIMSRKVGEKEREKYTSTHKVISLVRDEISSNKDLKLIMPEDPMIETSSGISVKVPIQFENNAGTIVSADYGTSESVENELLRSFRDIDLITRENEFSNVNSFLLLPAANKRESKKIDELVEDYKASLITKGVKTLSAHQLGGLVNKIDIWYKEVA